jgi:hypothetical protein
MGYSSEGIPSHGLDDLVYLIDLVHLAISAQPKNQTDQTNQTTVF